MNFTFESCHSLLCETGAIQRLADVCKERSISRPMLVTDQGMMATGLVDKTLAQLQAAGITVLLYNDVQADPPAEVVLDAAEQAKNASIDSVIGFGGGSSMDVAKLIAVLSKGNQALEEMYGVGLIESERLPLIQIPTTAGTGSEVTPIAIVTTGEATKSGIVSPQLLPDLAILDAELTISLPPHVTAATGVDAMVHAIEAYTSKLRKNPYSDMLAKQALTLLSTNIKTAVFDGDNLAARSQMLLGAMLAGQAFANAPVAAVHALAYPLGGHYHLSHGLSNSLVLPHVLQFNKPKASAHYAALLPCIAPQKVSGDEQKDTEQFISAIEQLIIDVELPSRLRDCGVTESALDMLAEDAMKQSRLLVNNPREVKLADALDIYQAAY